MTKPQYNQGDLLYFDVGSDTLLQLAVIIRVFNFHGHDHYELSQTDGQPSFLNRVSYIDNSTVWTLLARGQ